MRKDDLLNSVTSFSCYFKCLKIITLLALPTQGQRISVDAQCTVFMYSVLYLLGGKQTIANAASVLFIHNWWEETTDRYIEFACFDLPLLK